MIQNSNISTIFSFGGHVINAMAAEIFFSNLGKIGRLTLLDPGNYVGQVKVGAKYSGRTGVTQYGALNRVRALKSASPKSFKALNFTPLNISSYAF